MAQLITFAVCETEWNTLQTGQVAGRSIVRAWVRPAGIVDRRYALIRSWTLDGGRGGSDFVKIDPCEAKNYLPQFHNEAGAT
jgi:hypothetical protein